MTMFDYQKAFDRNLGWLTEAEQKKLRHSCIAVAGLGGAGGFQIQALARLGVGRFKIADPDRFELTNMNRQLGATCETLGRSKVAVIQEMILAINPDAKIEVYPDGIHETNIDDFLSGVDFAVDGIDFFALETKLLFFRKCREYNLPALTSCPLGFGASLIWFTPSGMSFEEYFDLRPKMNDEAKQFALAFGLSPTPLCLSYMNSKASELGSGRAASVCPGLMLVGAITGPEAVKYLTGKAAIRHAPYVYQTDLLTQRLRGKKYSGGMRHPLMKLKKWIVLQFFLPKKKGQEKPEGRDTAGVQPHLTAGAPQA